MITLKQMLKLSLFFYLIANLLNCTKSSDLNVKAQGTQEGYFTQRLNWQDFSDNRTLQNRYLVNSDYASGPNAPVIYVPGGESALNRTNFENGYIGFVVKAMHAHYVSLEHRFYGKSQPFDKLTGENLKFLNLQSTLSDLAAFQKYWQGSQNLTGKWFVWGGSYSGGLAAFYRLRYPDLAAGAISSSGTVHFSLIDQNGDKFAATAAGGECVRNFRNKILSPIENSLNKPDAFQAIKQEFGAVQLKNDMEFLSLLGPVADFLLQTEGPLVLCSTVDVNHTTPTEARSEFIKLMNTTFARYSLNFLSLSSDGFKSEKASDYSKGTGFRQWTYHQCAELGGWDTSGPDADHAFGSFLPNYVQLQSEICKLSFGLTEPPNVDKTNSEYYQRLLDPNLASKILFVNGSADPVSILSISKSNGNAVNPKFLYADIDGGTHCQDLRPPNEHDSQSLRDVRDLELKTLIGWVNDDP